ncbi:hypothetical protein BH23CHL7_BH23CHL7_15960 [soil metagenome]
MRTSPVFSPATADKVRSLLTPVRNSPRRRQKALRQRLRDLGFYISDFARPATGFTVHDFDDLVRSGVITIR